MNHQSVGYLLLLFLGFFSATLSQYKPITQKNEIETQLNGNKNVIIKEVIELKNGEKLQCVPEEKEIFDLIVEFNEEPFFIKQKKSLSKASDVSYYTNLLAQFRDDVEQKFNKLQKTLLENQTVPEITKEYYKVFFGAALKVPHAMLNTINNLPYVKKIHFNKTVKTSVVDGKAIIKADQLSTEFNTGGEGIRIGVLDTGIDYMHPFLGGGYGDGQKVVGGYDFVDDDDDPMDLHSHGTHVAGIIAGRNDSLSGVAPDASLYAYRVLDERGEGSESDVISAIERSLDPNGDEDITDKLDIVNMSLGSDEGEPDDAMSTAVNNAVSLGITFCIAAGNRGSYGFFKIASPGMAESAITVGATDKSDNLAYFSSKGPVMGSYSVKPDVLAPGVNINSSVLGEEYDTYSGTSMATPFVAGVAALLKSIHPDWTPQKIKSALMSTAVDLNLEVMQQGKGRINALDAADVDFFSNPQVISFGGNKEADEGWQSEKTITYYNDSETAKSYDVSFDGIIPGVTLSSDVNSFTINPQDSFKVNYSIEVDNSIVDYPPSGTSMTYEGNVYVTGSTDTLVIPWAFVKLFQVQLTFDQPYPFFDFIGDNNYVGFEQANWIDSYNANLVINYGSYDFICHFTHESGANGTYVKPVEISKEVLQYSFNINDAKNVISVTGVDNSGENLGKYDIYERKIRTELSEMNYLKALEHTHIFIDWYSITGELPEEDILVVPDLPETCTIEAFEMAADFQNYKSIYFMNFPAVNGIDSDYRFEDNSPNYVSKKIEIGFPSYADINAFPIGIDEYWEKENQEYFVEGIRSIDYLDNVSSNWTGDIYFTKVTNSNHIAFPIIQTFEDRRLSQAGGVQLLGYSHHIATPPLYFEKDSIMCGWAGDPTTTISQAFLENGLYFGIPPFYTFAGWTTNEQSNVIDAEFYVRGQFSDLRNKETQLSIYNLYDADGNNIASGKLKDFEIERLNDAEYSFEIVNEEYYLGSENGIATLKSSFDLSRSDAKPPSFTSLKLMDENGAAIKTIGDTDGAFLQFSVADFNLNRKSRLYNSDSTFINFTGSYRGLLEDSTKFFSRLSDGSHWEELPLIKLSENESTGSLYLCDLSHFAAYDSGMICFKIKTCDLAGNTTAWTMEPGIAIGDIGNITGIENEDDAETLPQTYSLEQNYPNPFNPTTTISYQISESGKVSLKVYDVLGREVTTLVNETQPSGVYSVEFNASRLASGVYIYRLKCNDFLQTRKLLFIK
ncbi:MAG: S8 family serine peptidase [Ignavibacteria bacterium]|jgi:subtilisin family serine protease